MSNPFDNVPSTADVQETVDKKTLTTLTTLTERFEAAISREEAVVKNHEELAGVMFENFLDDDGSLKDFAHTKRFESAMNHATQRIEDSSERWKTPSNQSPPPSKLVSVMKTAIVLIQISLD